MHINPLTMDKLVSATEYKRELLLFTSQFYFINSLFTTQLLPNIAALMSEL